MRVFCVVLLCTLFGFLFMSVLLGICSELHFRLKKNISVLRPPVDVVLPVVPVVLVVPVVPVVPEWRQKIDVIIPSSLGSSSEETERSRTDDHSLYWVLVSFSKHAPWVRNIYVYVNGVQELPYDIPGLNVIMVNRCDYMDHCPTMNSQAVLTGIHRIPELSEHFISGADDTMLGRPAKVSDFFTSEGKPYSWRKQPTWSDGIMGAHHRIYVNPDVFSGKTPTSASPTPHFLYPMLKSFATELAEEYSEWYAFVESHQTGRFSSQSNSINDKRNAQEECLHSVWSSTLLTSGKGVYKNIDGRRGEFWDEVVISESGFARAVRDKPLFMNVNDRFSKDPATYRVQVQWFWTAMEKLFGVKMKLKSKLRGSLSRLIPSG